MSTLKTIVNGPGHSQTLPATAHSYLEDPHGLFYLGDHSGHWELWFYWFDENEHDQLTHIGMKQAGSPGWERESDFDAFFPWSIAVDPVHAWAYFVAGNELKRVNLSGQEVLIHDLPENMISWGCPHLFSDNKRLALPVIDQDALYIPETQQPRDQLEKRMRYADLKSQILILDVIEQRIIETINIPHAFIDQVSFHPEDPQQLLYHKQYFKQDAHRRLWAYNRSAHIQLLPPEDTQETSAHILSGSWTPCGQWVIYSGYNFESDRAFIGRVAPDGSNRKEIDLPPNADQGNITAVSADILISDSHMTDQPNERFTVYNPDEPQTPIKDAKTRYWISRLEVDWESGEIEIDQLTPTDYDGTSTIAPPNPVTDPMGFFVYFTSYEKGYRSIRRANLESPEDEDGLW